MLRATAIILFLLAFLSSGNDLTAQLDTNKVKNDSTSAKKQEILRSSQVTYSEKDIKLTIQNVDISKYPTVRVIVEAYNVYGQPLDTLYANGMSVMENGVARSVISVEKLSMDDRVPTDFVFVVDQTGSMQTYIDAVRKKIRELTNYLKKGGIDYRLGLILFSDEVDKVYQPTTDVNEFLGWISRVSARGGGDVKENTLEALGTTATKIEYRPIANKVVLLITNSPFYEKGEKGDGATNYTIESLTHQLINSGVRVFSIVPPKLTSYNYISSNTRGNTYDIDYPFSTILDNFSNQLTNLYALKYRTEKSSIPDSINIAIVNMKKETLTKKTIPIVELGRKLIIENMLYKTGSSDLPDSVPELNVLTEFMLDRKNVVIMVEGHTDNVGSYAINDRLSKQRAEGVKRYLVRKGISPRRIKTTGYGESRPIATNETEFGRKLNRRTEIVIIAK